jgi:predicted RNA-binding Zn ribbon-like protein
MAPACPGLMPVNSVSMESRRDVATLDRVGGDPALDFVNTLGGALAGPWDDEWLADYADLVGWAVHARLVPVPGAAALLRRAAADPAGATSVYADAIAVREALYRVLAGFAAGEEPPAADLAALRDANRDALAHGRLASAGDGDRLDWRWPDDADLWRPLWPVVQAAVDLLRSEQLERLKQCRNCRWLFLDASRNRSRRWCSMSHCGSEAKVAATRERRQAARA